MLLTVIKGEMNDVIAILRALKKGMCAQVDRIDVKLSFTPFSVPQLARGVRLSKRGRVRREYRCRLKC